MSDHPIARAQDIAHLTIDRPGQPDQRVYWLGSDGWEYCARYLEGVEGVEGAEEPILHVQAEYAYSWRLPVDTDLLRLVANGSDE